MTAANDLREGLVRTLQAAEEREAELHALCSDVHSAADQEWNAKDHVAHLSAWREHASDALEAAGRGEEVPLITDLDGINARIYSEHRTLSAATVTRQAAASYARLRSTVQTAADSTLSRPRTDGGDPVWMVVLGDGCEHVAEHLSWWQLQHGDDAAAERTVNWGCEVITTLLAEPHAHGAALYNLACFYGRSGRSAEAAPLLRQSLAVRPELRALAGSDPDFAPIRDAPEFRELLSAG